MAEQAQRMTVGDAIERIMAILVHRRLEISAVLPPDITFDAFHASINQALRGNPRLLRCTQASLVNACIKAAYDGLRVDGVEACIVDEEATIRQGRGQPDRKEIQARYMPMYRGLVQQVLRGGMVTDIVADIIYEHDDYQIIAGTNRQIVHHPNVLGERGRPIVAYSVATFPDGSIGFVYMTAHEVREVQKMSRSGWNSKDGTSKGVWLRWEGEQWKKTVLRRHRKTLPVRRDVVIRDMEAESEFQQIGAPAAQEQLSARRAPPRPTREALQHQPDVSINDFGGSFDVGGEVIEAERGERERQEPQQQQRDAARAREQERAAEPELPQDDVEWGVWETEAKAAIGKAPDHEALADVQHRSDAVMKHAPKPVRDRLNQAFTDRAADIAAELDDGAAAGGDDNDAAAGDR
jgi:recombination protein RecT